MLSPKTTDITGTTATGTTPPVWVRSSLCGESACVEVADLGGEIAVRDSKIGDDSPVLRFTRSEWAAFIGGVRRGEFSAG